MGYADITFKDKNPIKRWLQRRRLNVAAHVGEGSRSPRCVLDFGAGNGELCKSLAALYPEATIICYEPTPELMAEARENLAGLPHIEFCTDVTKLSADSVDLLFCLEVFEHLPRRETEDALDQFERLLTAEGNAVIGVPLEVGIPALYKGAFRMTRRYGAYDATLKNILRAALYAPPKDRPVREIAPGFSYHFAHLGFDYRTLQARLDERFNLQRVVTSPFATFGVWLNPEANFVIRKNAQPALAKAA